MKIFEKQFQHLGALIILIIGVDFISRSENFFSGQFLGLTTQTWFWISIIVPIVHQVVVIFTWRAELHYQWMTNWFGERAFRVWMIGFTILFIARPISMVGLAIANRYTIPISPLIGISLALLCVPPVAYLGYSIKKYFGFERAFGQDHFEPERYRRLPFVAEGIFRWTPNAMYKFGFLALWLPGFLLLSDAALLSALFSHLYIWVHFFFTELPDMHHIYGPES
jgi:hypothetical protein